MHAAPQPVAPDREAPLEFRRRWGSLRCAELEHPRRAGRFGPLAKPRSHRRTNTYISASEPADAWVQTRRAAWLHVAPPMPFLRTRTRRYSAHVLNGREEGRPVSPAPGGPPTTDPQPRIPVDVRAAPVRCGVGWQSPARGRAHATLEPA